MLKNQNATLLGPQVTTISADRRSKRRYPINLPVQYKIMKNYLVIGTGTGQTRDLSSNGIAFESSEPLKRGTYVELSVSWPVLLNQSCPLKLVASGKVVRSEGQSVAIAMDRYEFRTQSAKAYQAMANQSQPAAGDSRSISA